MHADQNVPPLADALTEVLRPLVAQLAVARTLSAGKVGVLRHLAAHGRATTSELAGALRISPQGASLAAKELLALEYVAREPDADDRRRVWFVLTESGRARLDEEVALSRQWFADAVRDRLTDAEADALADVVPVLGRLAGVETGPAPEAGEVDA